MKIYRGCNARFQYRILRNVLVPKYWYMCNVMMQIIILFFGYMHCSYTLNYAHEGVTYLSYRRIYSNNKLLPARNILIKTMPLLMPYEDMLSMLCAL